MKPVYVVIMAGGAGTRFWPKSTEEKPKQFLDILGTGKTLLQHTVARFGRICPDDHIYIVTSSSYRSLVREQCPNIPNENILLEPCRRNTAACVAYASFRISKKADQANIVVAPADHLIVDGDEFIRVVDQGLRFVDEHAAMLTLGIQPHRPDTGYGYIQAGTNTKGISLVLSFREKPDEQTARAYLDSGEYLWNAGIFMWSLETILTALDAFLPDISTVFKAGRKELGTSREQSFVDGIFPGLPSVSIDYGIMEKSDKVYVLPADFGWSDLGTWGSLWENGGKDMDGNVVHGGQVLLDQCRGCMIDLPPGRKLAVQGLRDCIIVEANGMLMICPKEQEQQISKIQSNWSDYH